MIGQVKPCSTSHKSDNVTAACKSTILNSDSIAEEGEDESQTMDNQQVSMCRVKTSAYSFFFKSPLSNLETLLCLTLKPHSFCNSMVFITVTCSQ